MNSRGCLVKSVNGSSQILMAFQLAFLAPLYIYFIRVWLQDVFLVLVVCYLACGVGIFEQVLIATKWIDQETYICVHLLAVSSIHDCSSWAMIFMQNVRRAILIVLPKRLFPTSMVFATAV